jgi:hypothetical protein
MLKTTEVEEEMEKLENMGKVNEETEELVDDDPCVGEPAEPTKKRTFAEMIEAIALLRDGTKQMGFPEQVLDLLNEYERGVLKYNLTKHKPSKQSTLHSFFSNAPKVTPPKSSGDETTTF